MISKKDIIGIARHVVRRGSGYRDRRRMHSMREWLIGLSISVCIFCLLSVYAGYLFYDLFNGDDEIVFYESALVSYDQERVQAVLEQYGTRKRNFENLRADRSNVVLPVAEESEEGSLAVENEAQ